MKKRKEEKEKGEVEEERPAKGSSPTRCGFCWVYGFCGFLRCGFCWFCQISEMWVLTEMWVLLDF